MSYDIFSPIAPKMPKLGKGTHTHFGPVADVSRDARTYRRDDHSRHGLSDYWRQVQVL